MKYKWKLYMQTSLFNQFETLSPLVAMHFEVELEGSDIIVTFLDCVHARCH